MSGGIKVNEPATPAGLGWYLSGGGIITRTVRGMPDDISANGYMYSGPLPANYSADASKYYHDSLDAEQDVYQFNVNGKSGKFFIGKNKQIVVVPLSKIRISYTASGGANTPITSFNIITEDGTIYIFEDLESQSITSPDYILGYQNVNYTTAWYLSRIIAPLGTDTIRFAYNNLTNNIRIDFPKTAYVNTSNNSVYRNFTPIGSQYFTRKKTGIYRIP